MQLEKILSHINPIHDLDGHINRNNVSFIDGFKDMGLACLNVGKSFLRGGIVFSAVGAVVGTLYSATNGENIPKYLEFGAVVGGLNGAALDVTQLIVRYVYNSAKNDFLELRRELRKTNEKYNQVKTVKKNILKTIFETKYNFFKSISLRLLETSMFDPSLIIK